MKYKAYNTRLLSVYLAFIVSCVFINYFVDPFGIFHNDNFLNKVRPAKDKNHRISRIPELKLYKDKIKAIWIGSSKTGWSTNEEYESNLLNGTIKNLTINACTFEEAIKSVKNAVLIHPEIETVYFGVDYTFMKKVPIERIKDFNLATKKSIQKDEIVPIVLSLNSLNYSLSTISKNLKYKKQVEKVSYGNDKQYNKDILRKFENTIRQHSREDYKDFLYNEEKITYLRDLKKYLAKKGVQIVFFITPMHISERILLDKNSDINEFYKFKEQLAEIQPYYDFAIIDKYTCDEIRPDMQYFRDVVHTYPPLRKKVTNQLFKHNEDFGFYVTPDNVKQHNTNDYAKFNDYITKKPQLIEQIKEWSR